MRVRVGGRSVATMSHDVPPFWVAHVSRSFDSIGWSGLPHNKAFGCIDPPPFGKQCTILRGWALPACMAMEGCVAFTCPEPGESHIGERGIDGPVCQLRARRTPDERSHGMCKPFGCINVALSRVRRPASVHEWRSLIKDGGEAAVAKMQNPALLFLHGHIQDVGVLIPDQLERNRPLRLPSAMQARQGLLFAVDAVPVHAQNASDAGWLSARQRYRRRDLWRAERGGGRGGRDTRHRRP